MNQVVLTGFADEISNDADEQIATLQKTGVSHLELRGVGGANVLDLSPAAVAVFKQQLDGAGIGVSAIAVPGLLFAASAHLGEWSQAEYSGGDEGELRASAAFESQYDDKVRYHLGAEWQVPEVAVDLRAGFYTDPLPFAGPRDTDRAVGEDNPLVVMDQDRYFITLGAGVLVEDAVQLDAAWTRGTFERVEGQLKEENTSTRLFMGLSYLF